MCTFVLSLLLTKSLIWAWILDSIMGFRTNLIEKMQALIGVYYQLHSNGADYLKSLRTNWTFLDPNPDEVYDN